jgi:hypothetical protein
VSAHDRYLELPDAVPCCLGRCGEDSVHRVAHEAARGPVSRIYAIRAYRGRKDESKGFGWRDFRDLIIRARSQLGGPIVLVWDNVRLHLTAGIREFIDADAEWLTVFQLPTYAPDLNPQEGVWSLVKRDIGNLAAADLGQITRAVKRKLKMLQYRPEVINGCLAGTGLPLNL